MQTAVATAAAAQALHSLPEADSGAFMPLAPEYVIALQQGKFSPLKNYTPRRVTAGEVERSGQKTLQVNAEGGIYLGNQSVAKEITTWAELKFAHEKGIMPLINLSEHLLTIQRWSKLWANTESVYELLGGGTWGFKHAFEHYEHDRIAAGSGTAGPTGMVHQIGSRQVGTLASLLPLLRGMHSAPGPAPPGGAGAKVSSPSAGSSGRTPRADGVCMAWQDGKPCGATPCVRSHKCCRCKGDHPANKCKQPDPRLAPGYRARKRQ